MKKLIALTALAIAAGSLTGCVEEEPSMLVNGSVLFEGTIEDDVLICEATVDPSSIDRVSPRGRINIEELKNSGQFGPPFDSANATGGHRSFVFWAGIENRLEDSRQVGAAGGGGGQGGYEGLNLDANYIQVTGAKIEFPENLNDFPGGEFASELNKTERFSVVLESAGGAQVVNFPIVSSREIAKLEEVYQLAVTAATRNYNPKAIVPLIAEITIIGRTFSGDEVESNKFQYPIDVCAECSPDEFPTTGTCEATG